MNNLRKLIREQIESIMENHVGAEKGIVGADIVHYLKDLPETRDEVNWAIPRTFYTIPSLDNSIAKTEVYDKEFFTGWDRPYKRQGKLVPHKGEGYVAEFVKQFGELPNFRMGNNRTIEILNPKFKEWRGESEASMLAGLKSFGATD